MKLLYVYGLFLVGFARSVLPARRRVLRLALAVGCQKRRVSHRVAKAQMPNCTPREKGLMGGVEEGEDTIKLDLVILRYNKHLCPRNTRLRS